MEIQVVVVVFVNSKYILPKDITHAVEENFFACLPIVERGKNITEKIISSINQNKMQIRKKKIFLPFIKLTYHCYDFLI